jgi:hypothetical protein
MPQSVKQVIQVFNLSIQLYRDLASSALTLVPRRLAR